MKTQAFAFVTVMALEFAMPSPALALKPCTPPDTPDRAHITKFPSAASIKVTEELSCSAGAREKCHRVATFRAPVGYQMCKITCKSFPDNHSNYDFAPAEWVARDTEIPTSFAAFNAWVHAEGDSGFFDKRGSSMKIQNIRIWYIPASASNEERRKRGCVLP